MSFLIGLKKRAACSNHSKEQPFFFFDQSRVKSKQIVRFETCVFPRLVPGASLHPLIDLKKRAACSNHSKEQPFFFFPTNQELSQNKL